MQPFDGVQYIKEQRLQLQRVVEYGKNRNITVKITEIE